MSKAYARSFIPTPMASVAMGDAASVSEATWADEQPTLTRFKFLLLLPEEEALGWWQYIHWRFPLAVGWGAGAPPTPIPLYVDPTRWIPDYLKVNENLFSLVVATPQTMDWERLDKGGVLVLVGVTNTPGLDKAFSVVMHHDDYMVGVGYLGMSVPLVGSTLVQRQNDQIVPAFIPTSYWQTLVRDA